MAVGTCPAYGHGAGGQATRVHRVLRSAPWSHPHQAQSDARAQGEGAEEVWEVPWRAVHTWGHSHSMGNRKVE